MILSLAGALETRLRGAPAFTLDIVFIGKVKPVNYALKRVFSEGILVVDDEGSERILTFASIQSLAVIDEVGLPEDPATPEA